MQGQLDRFAALNNIRLDAALDAYDIAAGTRVRLPVLLQASPAELMKGLPQTATQSVQLADAAFKAAASAAAQATKVGAASKG